MFSMNKVELDLISDVDMYLSFQKCMKGDVSYIFKRHSKTNNKYLTSYDPKKQQNMLRTWTIYAAMLCQNLSQQTDLIG